MREILFRGKTRDNVWYHGFIKGRMLPNYEGNKMEFTPCIIEQPYADILVIPETVGQYTGLTDKNGTKIFEGDIVDIEHTFRTTFWQEIPENHKPRRSHSCYWDNDKFHYKRNYAVEWKEREARFILRNGSDQHDLRRMYLLMHNGIIIGNIHDNPELLKGGAE